MRKLETFEQTGDENPLEGLESNEAWRYAWSRAVAKAWQDPKFQDLLLTDTIAALKTFDYDVPNGLKLDVKKYEGNEAYQEQNGVNGWIHMTNELSSHVTMILPPAPAVDEQAIALADYQATGRTYPFTTA